MIRFATLVLTLLPVSTLANPIGEVLCAPSSEMTQRLSLYGHEREAAGLRGREQVMEVWTDGQGDWTMVVRYASGTSCIVAMGEAWQGDLRKDPA